MTQKLIFEMMQVFNGDSRRIEHTLKVHAFSKTIIKGEKIDPDMAEIIEIAALMHDIGITECEKKYNCAGGQLQQIEGPKVADKILSKYNCDRDIKDRVLYLISKHHTYKDVSGIDYQILIEADLIVNAIEGNISQNALNKAVKILFKTDTGKHVAENQFQHHDH